MQWTTEKIQAVQKYIDEGYSWKAIAHVLSQQYGEAVSQDAVRHLHKSRHMVTVSKGRDIKFTLKDVITKKTELQPQSKTSLDRTPTNKDKDTLIKLLKRDSYSVEDLSNKLKIIPQHIREMIEQLGNEKYNLIENNGNIEINTQLQQGGKHFLNEKMWQGDELRFGFTSDNHLCNRSERLDVLNLLYDIFADEGITLVLNGGNWIDGEARFNKNELHTRGMTKQIEYCVENYPYREGIKTQFVAGDDHEGWYAQREGINIGEYLQMKREQAGKYDMEHLGYMEADIVLTEEGCENQNWLRLMHPGGGTAYALSYAPQKIVEAYQGGEKPAVLMLGHYHKLDYCFPREVHVIQMGTTEDQTIFMRKKKLQAHVGGGIMELRRSPDGIINRCKVEFITAFDRTFYIGKDKYWK